MKKFTRIIIEILAWYMGIFIGSWLGAQIRPLIGAPASQGGMFMMQDDKGHTYQSTPVITHMLPGLALSVLAKPRWLMAFLGSFTASVLLGDQYERRMLLALGEKLDSAQKELAEEAAEPA